MTNFFIFSHGNSSSTISERKAFCGPIFLYYGRVNFISDQVNAVYDTLTLFFERDLNRYQLLENDKFYAGLTSRPNCLNLQLLITFAFQVTEDNRLIFFHIIMDFFEMTLSSIHRRL